jgi:hypothetical protein
MKPPTIPFSLYYCPANQYASQKYEEEFPRPFHACFAIYVQGNNRRNYYVSNEVYYH